jgi:predicted membrane channel-forming protein YqfA (hemolysin III family)
VSGYRINYSTWTLTLKSLFQLHNESVNVWTHLFGFFSALITIVVIACANSNTLQQTMAGTHQALSELIQQKKAEYAII